MLETLLSLLLLAAPATQPSTRPTPEWIHDPLGWRGFTGGELTFAKKTSDAHLKRWELFRALIMTSVADDAPFRDRLSKTLTREAVYIPNVPDIGADMKVPLPTTRPTAPGGPMTPALFASLASAVQDTWITLQDRPFDQQRDRYFKGRIPRVDHADIESDTIFQKLGEKIDASKLTSDEIWQVLRRLYDKRRAAFDGGFNLTGAALDSPRGIACQIFYRAPGKAYADGMLMARGNASGTGWDDYWRASLLVCARQFTHPPLTPEQLIERDGRVLCADVQVILELKNGERAPMVMAMFYEPKASRWWVTSSCFTSSPFIAVVGQVR